MNWIETHAHLYAAEFDDDRDQAIARARQAGISHILMPNVDLDSIPGMHALDDKYPGFCIPMMGLHPCSVTADFNEVLDTMLPLFTDRQYCAVGEIGIDLYWDKTTLGIQQKAFSRQIEFAMEKDLPIAIHSRNAMRECLDLLRPMRSPALRGVFHCFSDSRELALEAIDLGFHLGIGGVLTFKNSGLAEAIKDIPLEHMIMETDAPYLAPVPHRGKRNEPAYIPLVGDKLSDVLGIPVADVARISSENAKKLYGLS